MNVDAVRSQFPALERRHNDHPVAYFDAPGGTQVPRVVAEAMTEYLFHHNANTHWVYPTSQETDAIIANAREAMADLLGASSKEIAFGANMTTLTFHLARTLGRMWSAGDEVIITELDHHANVAPWRALQFDRGIEIRSAKMNCDAAQLDYDHLESLITPHTKLIAVTMAKAANVLMFVDARAGRERRGRGARDACRRLRRSRRESRPSRRCRRSPRGSACRSRRDPGRCRARARASETATYRATRTCPTKCPRSFTRRRCASATRSTASCASVAPATRAKTKSAG